MKVLKRRTKTSSMTRNDTDNSQIIIKCEEMYIVSSLREFLIN